MDRLDYNGRTGLITKKATNTMHGLGTIANVAAIIAGGLLGLTGGKFLSKRFQDILIMSCGLSTLFIGAGGAFAKMLFMSGSSLDTQGSMMMIGSLVFGSLIGEFLRIEDRLESFGEWLKQKSGNGQDGSFVGAFVTASLTVCIGAMAVVGSIEDGIYGNHSILFTKAVLDFVIIVIMTASMGKGCIFSAVSVGILQGLITLSAQLIKPIMTDAALNNLSYVGSVMIFCVGLNLMLGVLMPVPAQGAEGDRKPAKVKVGNMLPGLIIAVAWSFFV